MSLVWLFCFYFLFYFLKKATYSEAREKERKRVEFANTDLENESLARKAFRRLHPTNRSDSGNDFNDFIKKKRTEDLTESLGTPSQTLKTQDFHHKGPCTQSKEGVQSSQDVVEPLFVPGTPNTPDNRHSFSETFSQQNIEVPETEPTPHCASQVPITPDVRFTPVQKEKSKKGSFRNIEDSLKSVRKENSEMRATMLRVLAENAELKAEIAKNEAANVVRHRILLEAVQAMTNDNPTTSRTSRIVPISDFEEPQWPLRSCDLVINLNLKLKDASFRDQLVI